MGDWSLHIVIECESEEDAKRHMEAWSTIEPTGLFAMHIIEEKDDE